MKQFEEHFLMNSEDIKAYIRLKTDLFEKKADLEVIEIGDGNINYVFLVRELITGKSVVVKQADTLLRSSGRPLDISRSQIEAEILQIQSKLAAAFIPHVYCYDKEMATLIMEDISAYKNLRYELENKQIFPDLAEELSTFLAKTLLPTTDLAWDRQDKKRLVKQFVNIEMCDITEDLVFTEPYNDYKKQNNIIQSNQKFVEEKIYQNPKLISEVAKLRVNYMNNTQALIHGDLHSGSIFVNQKGIKVIDPEFAFYGPMGYDIGNVIGNLFFPLAKSEYYDSDNIFTEWLRETISKLFNSVKNKLEKEYIETVKLDLYQNQLFMKNYLTEIMADSLGYAGTEIIRRTIGDSRVKEIVTAPLGERRTQMERQLLLFGIKLILNRYNITSGEALIKEYELSK